MSWTTQIWERTLPFYNAILGLPFLSELAEGTLPAEKFSRYIAQDEIYLGRYGRLMLRLADLLDDPGEKALFQSFAKASIDSEKEMHRLLIEKGSIDCNALPSPITTGYLSHTQAAINSGKKEIALAAILPCNWIYNRVGLDILKRAKLDANPYREWILEYGNEEFTAGNDLLLEMIDRWAERADTELLNQMQRAFTGAARFEYAFWNYAYTGNAHSAFTGLPE